MASLEASLSLRDRFTDKLKKIDDSIQKTAKGMDNFKDKISGPTKKLGELASVAQSSMSKFNSGIRSGLTKATSIVQSSVQRILSLFGSFGNSISSKLNLNGVTSKFASAFGKIRSTVSNGVSGVGDIIKSLASKVSSGFSSVTNAVKNGTRKIGNFLKESGNAFKQYGSDMKNAFDKMKHSASSAGGGFKSMVAAIGVTKAVGMGINLVSNGVKTMVDELSSAGATWKVFEGNMSMLGKSSNEIGEVKKELQQFAQQTIYSASDMASTYSQLAAVGVKNTTQLVKGFGGLAAAAEDPAQAMKTLSQQATQMAAKPAVQWADFKLMLEQTPAGIAAIAKTMGMTTSQLVSNVQEGTIKTQDFFDAITKTGNNAAFTKMATEFKTIGQAMDGLTEGLTNKLQPTFDKIAAFGIKKISQLADYIDTIDFDKAIGDMVNKVKPYLEVLKTTFNDIKQPVSDAFNAIKESLKELNGSTSNLDSFKSFMEGVAETIKKVAGFAEKHSDSIAKLIDILPKLAMAFVGFKIGKGVLSPLLSFGSGILGITKATAKLGGGLGKAFTGLFKKMPKMPKKKNGGPLEMFDTKSFTKQASSFKNTLKGFAKGASNLAIVFGVIKLVEVAAEALKQVNDKVPKDLSVLGPKMLNMGIALVAMGAFVKAVGRFSSKNPKAAIGGLLAVAGLSGNIMLAAESLKQLNDKVSDDIGNIAMKMASMAVAIGGMAILVGAVGLFARSNPSATIAGLLTVAAISLELMVAAEAMQQVNDKVPSNIADFASKVANMAIAIGGMAVLAGAVGAVVSSGIGALILAGGLLTIALIAGELMLVAEAIQQMDQKIPSDLSSVKKKIDNIAEVIQYFTDANLGSILDVLSNTIGVINTSVVITGVSKFTDLASALEPLTAVNVNVEKVKGNIDKIKEVVNHLSDGGSIFDKLKSVFSNSVDVDLLTTAKKSVSQLVDIGTSLNQLQLTTFNAAFVKKKIDDINDVVANLGSSGIGGVISAMVKTSQLNKVKETLTGFLELFEPINGMSNTPLLTGSAKSKIGFIEDLISSLGAGSISGVISSMVKATEISKVKDVFDALFDLYGPINALSTNAVSTGSAKSKIGYINELIATLGTATLGKVIGTMLKSSDLRRVKSALEATFELFAPINLLSSTPLLTGSASSKIGFIGDLIKTIGVGSLGAIIGTMLKVEELGKVKLTLEAVFALYEPINLLSNTAVLTGSASSKIGLIQELLKKLSYSTFGVVLFEMITAESLTNANNTFNSIVNLANAINRIGNVEIDVTRALDTINNVKMIIRQLNQFPEIVGLSGLEMLVSTFNKLAQDLQSFVSVAQVSISGLQTVSLAFNANMITMEASVSTTMTSINAKTQSGMASFNLAIQTGMMTAAGTAKTGKVRILSAFDGMSPALFNSGLMAMAGLTRGINAGAGAAISAATRVANQVAAATRKALDVRSPSRVFAAIGKFIPAGLAVGIEKAKSLVQSASNSLAQATIPNNLANVSASGTVTSNVMLDDSEISRLKASASQKVVVNSKQLAPQVTVLVDNNGNDPIDIDEVVEKIEDKIIELIDSDLG